MENQYSLSITIQKTILIFYIYLFYLQIMNRMKSPQKVQQNIYGIRHLESYAASCNKNMPPKRLIHQQYRQNKKPNIKKLKKAKTQPIINQWSSQSDNPKLVFLDEYKLIKKDTSENALFTKPKNQMSEFSCTPRFTRRVSYVRLIDQYQKRQQSHYTRRRRRTSLQTSKSYSKNSIRKLSSISIIPHANVTQYQKISLHKIDNSISTRPASVSKKNCFSIIKNVNNSNKQPNYSLTQELKCTKDSHSIMKVEQPLNRNNKKQVQLTGIVIKNIPQQPQSNIGSGSNYSGKSRSYSKSSKFKSIILLPIQSKRKEHNHISGLQSMKSFNSQLQGYLIVEACLDRINLLAEYSQQIIQKYQDISDWDQLVFLVYKKFYLERKKLVRALLYDNAKYFSDFIKNTKDKRKLQSFIRHYQCQKLIQDLVFQNLTIEQSLRNLYNLIIEKSGQYVNLLQFDTFTMRIFVLLLEQIQLLKDIYETDKEEVQKRLKNILYCSQALADIDKLEFRSRLKLLIQQVNKIKIVTMGALFSKVQLFYKRQVLI